MASAKSIIDQLNSKYPVYLQLFTWHHLQIPNGKETTIVALTSDSFTVRVNDGKEDKNHVYSFTSEEKANFRDLKTRTEKVLASFIGPHLPPLSIHVINLWIIGIVGYLPLSILQDYDFLVNAKGWVMKLFVKEEYALYYLLFLIVSHLGEMLYSLFFLLPSLGFPMSKFSPWALYVFAIGYPVTSRLVTLSKIAKKSIEKKKLN